MLPNATIKTILEGLTGSPTYVRASTLEDLEEKSTDFGDEVLAVHSDLPVITNNQSIAGAVVREYPVEVLFLTLDDIDSQTESEDTIRDAMAALADEFYDKLAADSIVSKTTPLDSYTLNAVDSRKILTEVYTGIAIECTLYIDRDTYCC